VIYFAGMYEYELTLVLDGKTQAAKKKKVLDNLEKVLKIFKGTVKKSEEWGVKELAYKLGKSETGLYLYFELEMEPASLKGLNDKLRTDEDVLRYLIVRKDK